MSETYTYDQSDEDFSDPVLLRAQKALSDALEQITVANGYRHDLASSVFRGRDVFGKDDPLPAVAILEDPEFRQQSNAGTGGDSFGEYPLFIQGWVRDDKENPTDPAHVLMADVKIRLGLLRAEDSGREERNLLGMNGSVSDLVIGRGVVRPPDQLSSQAYFWLPLTIVIAESMTRPYNN